MCSSKCSLTTLMVKGQVPIACDVATFVVGYYGSCLVSGFGAKALLGIPLP